MKYLVIGICAVLIVLAVWLFVRNIRNIAKGKCCEGCKGCAQHGNCSAEEEQNKG